jgi:hypothetical protein
MMTVFAPVRVKGKLMAKNTATGEIASKGIIRDVQLRSAEANREVLVVNPVNGRVTRVPAASAGVAPASVAPVKASFVTVLEDRDPEVMFSNLSALTRMVGRGVQPSLVVTGMAGMGKTHIVKNTLIEMGLKESTDFVHFKGRATAAGLFITLYQNSNSIIILDDCDSVFRDENAVNILKGALDSYDTRKISYITSKPLKDEFGDALPMHFEFTGKIIFISNISQANLDEAIKSRSFVADISMTTDQLFTRMDQLMAKMETKIPMAAKEQALAIMKDLHSKYEGVAVNLRSFIKAARICAMGFEDPTSMIAEQIIGAE